MHFDWSTFALQTVNFVILVWLLQRFLYRPVLRMVDARRAEIDKRDAAAQQAEAEAKARLEEIEAERRSIAAERSAALEEAAAQAEKAAAARRAQADRDAVALLENARKVLADERSKAMAEARHAALDLGADIAGRLLAEVPMKLRAQAWIDRIEAYLAALSEPDIAALSAQLANGVPVKLVTASALPAAAEEVWRTRLRRRLGDRIDIAFAVDPALVAGVELHFPNAVLRFSWRSLLAALEAQIEADGGAR